MINQVFYQKFEPFQRSKCSLMKRSRCYYSSSQESAQSSSYSKVSLSV